MNIEQLLLHTFAKIQTPHLIESMYVQTGIDAAIYTNPKPYLQQPSYNNMWRLWLSNNKKSLSRVHRLLDTLRHQKDYNAEYWVFPNGIASLIDEKRRHHLTQKTPCPENLLIPPGHIIDIERANSTHQALERYHKGQGVSLNPIYHPTMDRRCIAFVENDTVSLWEISEEDGGIEHQTCWGIFHTETFSQKNQ